MSSARPRVAIDAHTVGRRATGNETYVRQLAGALIDLKRSDSVVLVDREADLPLDTVPYARRLQRRGAVGRLLGELARPGVRWGADLLHVQYVRPPICDVPVVTTVHDISYEHFPEMFTRRTRLRMRATIPWSARHSAAVLTGSRYSQRDLIERYDLPIDRVHVTPYAVGPEFARPADGEIAAVVQRHGLPADYLLYVGNLQPRKNLPRLLDAFVALHARGISVPLVVVGQRAWLSDGIFEAVRRHGLARSVTFTGYVAQSDLPAIYAGAHAFAYPSLFEGFGFPVLEALACGTPTLTSSVSSLPEVAGEAAVLVDPRDTEAIAHGLEEVVSNEALREELRVAGPLQASRFSWKRCAMETVNAYYCALA